MVYEIYPHQLMILFLYWILLAQLTSEDSSHNFIECLFDKQNTNL